MQPETTIMPKPGDTVWYFDTAAHFDEFNRGSGIKPFNATVESVVGANCVNLDVTDESGKSVHRSGITLWQPADEGKGFPNGPSARWPDDKVGEMIRKNTAATDEASDDHERKIQQLQQSHVTNTEATVTALKPEGTQVQSDKPADELDGSALPTKQDQYLPGAGQVAHPGEKPAEADVKSVEGSTDPKDRGAVANMTQDEAANKAQAVSATDKGASNNPGKPL